MARRSTNKSPSTLYQIKPPVKKSTSDLVFESLREAILSQALPGGTALVEAQLAEQFAVSKTPIREALQRLTHLGLVDFELARGATVHTFTIEEIRDVFELRMLLEPIALKQGALELTSTELEQIEATLKAAQSTIYDENWQALSIHNNNFHQSLYQHAHNQLLLDWLQSLNDRHRMFSLQGWERENRSLQEWQEHKAILEAVKAGAFEQAAQLMATHIERFSQIVVPHSTMTHGEQ